MWKPVARACVLSVLVGLAAGPALAQAGSPSAPIVIQMKRGTDYAVLHGVLRQNRACCTYIFKARAGQRMYWTESGAVVRMVITYPDGSADGPGLPNPQPLPKSGTYTLAITPDLMADGAFGPYTVRIRIPPR